jgi:hypothetical protein
MYVWYQIFITLAVISCTCANNKFNRPTIDSSSALANESDDCKCDVLEINGGLIFYQNFRKQNDTHNGKPYYFSDQWNLISWKFHHWSYEKYDTSLKKFVTTAMYNPKFFSFDHMCKNVTGEIFREGKHIFINSRCLRDNGNCSATNDLTKYF